MFTYLFHIYLIKNRFQETNNFSHASDPKYQPMKNGDCETVKVLIICFEYYEQSNWLKKDITVLIISLYDIRSLAYDP